LLLLGGLLLGLGVPLVGRRCGGLLTGRWRAWRALLLRASAAAAPTTAPCRPWVGAAAAAAAAAAALAPAVAATASSGPVGLC
jgi:hypothetical protein